MSATPDTPSPDTSRSHARHRVLRALFLLAMIGIATPWFSRAVAGVPTAGWLVDLGSHWQWLFVPAAMFAGIFAWRGLGRLTALLVLGAGLYGLWAVMPPLAATSGDAGAQSLRVVTANVMYTADNPANLLDWARGEQAEVILLQEVGPGLARALDAQADGYPHRHLAPRDDPFGVGVLSRYALSDVRITQPPGGMPMLHATVNTPDGAVPVIVAHPFPPLTEAAHRARADTIGQLDTLAATRPELIVGGDFNATPWSSAFAHVTHLGIASRGLPTWREVLPIDHVLVGRAWALKRADRGPSGASDHRPLVVELTRITPANDRPAD